MPRMQAPHKSTTAGSIIDTTTSKPSTIRALRVPKFLRSLYKILQFENQSTLAWSKDGTYFQIFDTTRLETIVLPKYFKHGKFASFQRQLNNFGFRKWTKTQASVCTFSHHRLVRCHPQQLIDIINRRTTTDCVRSGADASSTIWRKRTLTEISQYTDDENFTREKDSYNRDENISTVAPNFVPRWVADSMGFLKSSEEYVSTSASWEQALSFSVEELHDITLPNPRTLEHQDSSRSTDTMDLHTLNECVDLGTAASFYTASNLVASELFPSTLFSWNSDSFSAPIGLTQFEQERGCINVKSK